MTETKNAHEGAVTSIADTDLVMVVGPQGGLHPISFTNLLKAVKGAIQIGGRNLLKDSGTPITTNNYHVKDYPCTEQLSVGERVRVTIWGNLGAGKAHFQIIYGGGDDSCGQVALSKISDGVYCGNLTILKAVTVPKINVYTRPQGVSAVSTISRIKLERGNIATDYTPAPEDIASGTWGGVIGYLPITYNYAAEGSEKGGAHESDEGTIGCAEISADCHLAFGSLDDMCRFIGSIQETGAGSNIDLSIPRLQCKRAERHRHISSCFGFDELPIKSKWKLMLRNGWSRWCDTEFLPIRRRRLFVQKVQSRVYLEELDARIANRKEVAYAD